MPSAISYISKTSVQPKARQLIPLDPVKRQPQANSVWLVLTDRHLLLSSKYARHALLVASTLLIVVLFYFCPPTFDNFRNINLFRTQDHEVVNETAAAVLQFSSGGSLSTTIAGVMSMVDKVERENTVMMTVLTPKFEMFMENWDCYAKPLIGRQFLVFTTDYEFGRRISEEDGYHVLVHGSNLTGAYTFGSHKYNEMVLMRTVLANELLEAGNSVFIFDNDAVWFSDPLPYLFNDSSADLVSTRDGRQLMSEVLCGGFLLLKQTPTTRRVWSKVKRLFTENLEASGHDNEQWILNRIIREERNVTAVREKGFEPLKVGFLDPVLFPNGLTYFVNELPQKMGVQPVVVHNNWVEGPENKLERFHKSGLWAVDDAAVNKKKNKGRRTLHDAGRPLHKCKSINRSPKKGRTP